ncbi:hypothetical protein AX761_22030 [Rhizobium sp. 58]|nr:hypothetical protein AX761_22030 [Rhizobium sp. 58]
MVNLHRAADRQGMMLTCCLAAVRRGFPHVALRDIIEPPHGWFDAMLARQIALHLLECEFNVPRRRIAEMTNRQRGVIRAAMLSVDARLECPVFAKAYARMARRSHDLFFREVRKAAA